MTVKRKSECPATPRKKRYAVERHAISAVLRAARRSGLPLRVYRCPACHGWHLTKRRTWHPSYGPKRAYAGGSSSPAPSRFELP